MVGGGDEGGGVGGLGKTEGREEKSHLAPRAGSMRTGSAPMGKEARIWHHPPESS